MGDVERILIIKLGALGDFIQALGPMAAIRHHHRGAHITLLTTRPYVALAEASRLADEVWADRRPKAWQVCQLLTLRARLRGGRFGRVYDLQTSDRSNFYFQLMRAGYLFGAAPEWSGIAPGCSHPHSNPHRDALHTTDRQREQLAAAGIADTPLADLSWVDRGIDHFGVRAPYALLVPGGAAHRPAKRWAVENYVRIARRLMATGTTPVLVGGEGERGLAARVARDCPGAVDLAGKTDFLDLAALARGADVAVGNDTGPMHLIAVAGCPSLVLFSADSDPRLCAPRGRRVRVLARPDLRWLDAGEVGAVLTLMRASTGTRTLTGP